MIGGLRSAIRYRIDVRPLSAGDNWWARGLFACTGGVSVSGRSLSLRVFALLALGCVGAFLGNVSPASAEAPAAPLDTAFAALAPPRGAYIEKGITMHYYAGLFEKVARNRGMKLRTDVDGYASRRSCGELGRVIMARIRSRWTGGWGPWRRYQVLDCTARRDLAYQRKIGLVLEVDYKSAVKTGF